MALSIPLPILLGLIVGGIGGTLVALHAIGWSTPARLDAPDTAAARFGLDYPDDTVLDVILADDGSAALLLLDGDDLGLVAVLGDRFVVRRLGAGALSSLRIDPGALLLRLHDIGFPRATVRIADGPERAAWVERLSHCVSTALAS